eukprot:5168063-Pyramimonas_sp.AAC.1
MASYAARVEGHLTFSSADCDFGEKLKLIRAVSVKLCSTLRQARDAGMGAPDNLCSIGDKVSNVLTSMAHFLIYRFVAMMTIDGLSLSWETVVDDLSTFRAVRDEMLDKVGSHFKPNEDAP